jgi:hypothetical protein
MFAAISTRTAILLLFPLLGLAKVCSLVTLQPERCDWDQWHQEIRTMIGPSTTVDVRCWDLGRNVADDNKWFYVVSRDCWIPGKVLGTNCQCG